VPDDDLLTWDEYFCGYCTKRAFPDSGEAHAHMRTCESNPKNWSPVKIMWRYGESRESATRRSTGTPHGVALDYLYSPLEYHKKVDQLHLLREQYLMEWPLMFHGAREFAGTLGASKASYDRGVADFLIKNSEQLLLFQHRHGVRLDMLGGADADESIDLSGLMPRLNGMVTTQVASASLITNGFALPPRFI
jgi:hypothetical protein